MSGPLHMGTLKTFLSGKGITEKHVIIVSRRLETYDEGAHALLAKRWAKRRSKEDAAKKYSELGIEKPKMLGRGVTSIQLSAAMADKPVSKRVRTKILRAVNHLLVKKNQPAADMKALFEGAAVKAGKKPKDEKKA